MHQILKKNKLIIRVISFILILSMLPHNLLYVEAAKANVSNLTEKNIYNTMIALKKAYPEGMRWTNDNYYEWDGGIYSGGFGCAAFAFILSDAVFGDLPAHKITKFKDVRVGDVVRINNDTHSVVVLKIDSKNVTLAEGNYNSSVHWGRVLSVDAFKQSFDYALTRYPETRTLTFKSGTGTGSLNALIKTKGSTVTITKARIEAFTRKGYVFSYFEDANGKKYKEGDRVTLSKNITLTAKYKKVKAPTAAVTGLKLTSPKTKQLKITYKKVSGADGYRIQYSTNKDFKNTKTVYTTKSSYTLKNLNSKKRYYVKITAYKLDSQNKKVYSTKKATKNLKIK